MQLNEEMDMQRLLRGFLIVFALSGESQAMMEADKFIGAWRLVSAEFRNETGLAVESPYGKEPYGILIYDAQGAMSAQLSQGGRKPFAADDRLGASNDEVRGAFESYQAYAGKFSVDEKARVVIHSVTMALVPNRIGTELRREYEFKDGRLILRTPPTTIGGKRLRGELVWERIKIGKPW